MCTFTWIFGQKLQDAPFSCVSATIQPWLCQKARIGEAARKKLNLCVSNDAWLQLRFDYDTTTIRLRRIACACFQFDASKKMNMSIFRRSPIVVESQLWYRLNKDKNKNYCRNVLDGETYQPPWSKKIVDPDPDRIVTKIQTFSPHSSQEFHQNPFITCWDIRTAKCQFTPCLLMVKNPGKWSRIHSRKESVSPPKSNRLVSGARSSLQKISSKSVHNF